MQQRQATMSSNRGTLESPVDDFTYDLLQALTSKLEAQPEPVQTTRDLLALTTAPEGGHAWAGSGQARLLRRSNVAGTPTWVRMSGALGLSSSFIAVGLRLEGNGRVVRAVTDDGAVVEGRLA